MSSLAIKVVFPKALYPASKTVVGAGNPYSKHTCCLALPAVNMRTQGDRQKKRGDKRYCHVLNNPFVESFCLPKQIGVMYPTFTREDLCDPYQKGFLKLVFLSGAFGTFWFPFHAGSYFWELFTSVKICGGSPR